MAFFPYVNPGDPVKPSTLLENNIRDVVNQFNATGELPVSRGAANSYRLQGWNNNDYTIPAGASVEIVADATWAGDAPQIRYASSNADLWGITACVINPGEIGSVIFAGLAWSGIRTSYSVGTCLRPDGTGGFRRSDSGAVILCKKNNTPALMLGWSPENEQPHMFNVKLENRDSEGGVKVFAIISNPPKYIVAFNKVTSNSEAVFINTEIDVTEFIRGKSRFGIHIKLLGFADNYNGAYFEYIASLGTFDFQNNFRPSSCIAVIDEAGDIAYEYNGTGNYFYIDGQGRTESTGAMYFPLYSDDGIEYIGVDIQNSDIHPRPRTLAPEILNHYIRLEQPDGEPSIDWDVYVLLLIDEADHWRYHAEVVTGLKTDDEPEGMNIKVQYRACPNADNTPLNFANRYLL